MLRALTRVVAAGALLACSARSSAPVDTVAVEVARNEGSVEFGDSRADLSALAARSAFELAGSILTVDRTAVALVAFESERGCWRVDRLDLEAGFSPQPFVECFGRVGMWRGAGRWVAGRGYAGDVAFAAVADLRSRRIFRSVPLVQYQRPMDFGLRSDGERAALLQYDYGLDAGTVTVLDLEGRERWSGRVSVYSMVDVASGALVEMDAEATGIRVTRFADGRELWRVPPPSAAIAGARWRSFGDLAVWMGGTEARVHDIATGRLVASLPAPAGAEVLSADRGAVLWRQSDSICTLAPIGSAPFDMDRCSSADLTEDAVVISDSGGEVRVYDRSAQRLAWRERYTPFDERPFHPRVWTVGSPLRGLLIESRGNEATRVSVVERRPSEHSE